jgi:hypothetical protein
MAFNEALAERIRRGLALPATSAACRQFSFSFRRVFPAGLLRFTRHEPDAGDEGVEQARGGALAGDGAEVVVHRLRPSGDPALK